jgi:hypothetical protein
MLNLRFITDLTYGKVISLQKVKLNQNKLPIELNLKFVF